MSTPFLSNLGVSALDQARTPVPAAFPVALNPNNKSEWMQACSDLVTTGEAATDWGLTLKRYVQLCEDRGVYPFQSVHQSRNDQISDYLRDRRREFVKFVNRANFFDAIKIRTTERKVTVTDRGFVLTVTAHCQIKDPSFGKWLSMMPLPKFDFVVHEGRHIKHLDQGLDMFVINERLSGSAERWIIGYDITCPIYPDLPNEHLPSKAEIEKFVLDILWMPLLRSMRPQAALHRLI